MLVIFLIVIFERMFLLLVVVSIALLILLVMILLGTSIRNCRPEAKKVVNIFLESVRQSKNIYIIISGVHTCVAWNELVAAGAGAVASLDAFSALYSVPFAVSEHCSLHCYYWSCWKNCWKSYWSWSC